MLSLKFCPSLGGEEVSNISLLAILNAMVALPSSATTAPSTAPAPSTTTAAVQPAQQPTQAQATVIFQSKPPVLRSCAISARCNFREAYREYIVQNALEASRHCVAPAPVPVVATIDVHVLDSICRSFLDDSHQGEPSAVNMQHVEDFVMGTGHYASALPLRSGYERALQRLKMPLKGDPYVRVDKLLRKKRDIVREYRCGDIKEKDMVQYLLSAVQPQSLRQLLKELINAGSPDQRACRADCKAFERLLIRRVVEWGKRLRKQLG